MLREDGVSNLVALSVAALIFIGLFGFLILETSTPAEVTVPGNHDRLASELYGQPVVGEGTCEVEAKDQCWYTLGLLAADGTLDQTTRDIILDGVRSTGDTWNLTEGEMATLVDGWFSVQPFSVTRQIDVIVIETAQDCDGDYDSPWPQYADDDVDCLKVVPGNPPCHKASPPEVCIDGDLATLNPDVVVVNSIGSWDFEAVEDWFAVNPNGLLVMANVNDASDLTDAQSYLNGAVPSYLGGLYNLQYPDAVDAQAGTTGDAPVSDEDIWHIDGAIASTRPGSLPNQVIITSQPMTAPVFENLLARGEGFWLEYGERDDFNVAERLLTDGTTLHLLQAWSAPRTH